MTHSPSQTTKIYALPTPHTSSDPGPTWRAHAPSQIIPKEFAGCELEKTMERVADNPANLLVMEGGFEQIPGILWLTDLDLCMTRMGGNELIYLGTPDLSSPCPVQDFFEADAPGRCLEAHHLALGCMRGTFVFVRGPKTFLAHVEPLFDLDGDLIGTIGLATDITESQRVPEADAAIDGTRTNVV